MYIDGDTLCPPYLNEIYPGELSSVSVRTYVLEFAGEEPLLMFWRNKTKLQSLLVL